MHKNSEELFKKYALNLFKPNMKILEVGPDRQVYNKRNIDNNIGINNYSYYYTDIHKEYINKLVVNHWNMASTYVDSPELPHFIPMVGDVSIGCEDNTFDIVYACNVIEHVSLPWVWLAELKRITKPNGHVVVICPGITTPYHREPIDCWRIWPDGFVSLFKYIDLECEFTVSEHIVPENDGYKHLDTIAIGRKK